MDHFIFSLFYIPKGTSSWNLQPVVMTFLFINFWLQSAFDNDFILTFFISHFIGSGGNINKVFRLANCKNGKPLSENKILFTSYMKNIKRLGL
jgi:hypothetical protein